MKRAASTSVLLVLGFVLLLGSAAAEIFVVRQQQLATGWLQRTFRVVADVNRIRTLVTDAETGQRGYLLTGQAAYLKPYDDARGALGQALSTLARDTAGDDAQAAALARLRPVIDAKLAELQQTVELRRAGRLDAAQAMVRTDRGRDLMNQVRNGLTEIEGAEFRTLTMRSAEYEALNRLSQAFLMVTPFLVLALGAISFLDGRRQLREAQEVNRRLSAEVRGREAAESRVVQLQKMEAVGQLTGGIAHDFNNMLSVIVGSLDLARRRLAPTGDARALQYLDQAAEGADRAAVLTSRLLAFARRQPLEPRVLDVNKLVSSISQLLVRTIGEHIRIETVQGAGLWRIRADAAQLESALVNLAVNARDAMPDGGKLTLETANVDLDERYAASRSDLVAGPYVMISITDDGAGMSAETLQSAFEPFFTTKEVGKGTGLGLSQVFGFAKQSGGHVALYSELGHGTTAKLYMPRYAGPEVAEARAEDVDDLPRGQTSELVLVVEDDDAVRRTTVDALRDLGYSVIHANGAAQALAQLETHPGVCLLLTDIVMPEVNGRQLADRATAIYPGLKVVYSTGYTRNAVVHNGVVDTGAALLTKPFNQLQLARKVREVLGEPADPAPAVVAETDSA